MGRYLSKNLVISFSAILATLILFQNCSPLSVLESDGLPSGVREQGLVVAFGDSLTRGANPQNSNNTGIKGYVPLLETKFPSTNFLNCGIGGQTTSDAKARFLEIIDGNYTNCTLDTKESASTAAFYDYQRFSGRKPDHILLWLGTNDVLKNTPLQSQSLANLRWFLEQATSRNIRVIMSNLPPYGGVTGFANMITIKNGVQLDRIQTFNALIDQVAAEFGVKVINTYETISPRFQQYTWDQIHLNSEAYGLIAKLWEDAILNNVGKELFVTLNQPSCSVATGHRIPSGVAMCSCASQTEGKVYLCVNGTPSEIFSLNQACGQATENHEYITHHCSN